MCKFIMKLFEKYSVAEQEQFIEYLPGVHHLLKPPSVQKTEGLGLIIIICLEL